MNRLIPEWHPSEAVILAWPTEYTDWMPWLKAVRRTYIQLMEKLTDCGVKVLLLCHKDSIEQALSSIPTDLPLLLIEADYNDTWTRDYAFLTVSTPQGPSPVEFVFNGWGDKFDAFKDNNINKDCLFSLCQRSFQSSPLVFEGGAVEVNDAGLLLTTSLCISNPKRNGHLTSQGYKKTLTELLGITGMTILEHGHLEGDDTDAHIDTLVRFTPTGELVIQSCRNRPQDSHYNSLNNLVSECRSLFPTHSIIELPLCSIRNERNERLPASYANYLVCNECVLLPLYQQKEDSLALELMEEAFPNHTIVGVDCLPLIQQFGSLHCITMQVPKNTLKPEVLKLAESGLAVLSDDNMESFSG